MNLRVRFETALKTAALGTAISLGACHAGTMLPEGTTVPPQSPDEVATQTDGITKIGRGFDRPEGTAVDAAGDVFAADTGDNTVKKVTPRGSDRNDWFRV